MATEMRLILTEKPSTARDFARALGLNPRDGYFEGKGTVVVCAFGHLFELFEPEDYDPALGKWSWEKLPIVPERFRRKPKDAKARDRVSLIRKLLAKVSEVVLATDAEREGELIGREILEECGWEGRTLRFWTSLTLTPEVVRAELKRLRPAEEYDRLYRAALVRQRADWLVGMNLSRAATLAFGKKELFSVGRVQTAVLAILVTRRRERESFKPEPYWVLRADFSKNGQRFVAERIAVRDGREEVAIRSRDEAERLLSKVSRVRTGVVVSVERNKKREAPPLLYDLTELQREAARFYGFSAKKTLALAQKLYEDYKVLSYPRTESRYLGRRNFSLVKSVLERLSGAYPDVFRGIEPSRVSPENKRVFNDSGLTDHHALIPLAPLPEDAGRDDRRIYELVLRRFAAVFHPDHEYESTRVVIELADEKFRASGRVTLKPGWRALYGKEPGKQENGEGVERTSAESQGLPVLRKGEGVEKISAELKEKKTQPPPDYTEDTLLAVMKSPAGLVEEENLKKIFRGDKGLGTQATRAEIIETLCRRGYVKRVRKKLIATDKGCFLVEALRKTERASVLTDPAETARWEEWLAGIAHGERSERGFIEGIVDLVRAGVSELKRLSSGTNFARERKVLGKCPLCGADVVEGRKGYGCVRWKEGCGFVIWKEIAGKRIPESAVRTLLSGKITRKLKGFRARSGKKFEAGLKLVKDESGVRVEFVF